MLLPLQGAIAPTRDTQGVASLALGYVLHWAFSPYLLNPKCITNDSRFKTSTDNSCYHTTRRMC